MFTFRETWKIILFITACVCTSSGAPVSCDEPSTEVCLTDFLQELENTVLSNAAPDVIASDICNASYPKYQQCISGCNPPIKTTNIWVKAAEYLCSTNETAQTEGLTCLAKPQVALGVQMCNANIPLSTNDFCGTRDAYLSCVQRITISLCSPMGDAVVRDYLLYSLQSASNAYNCDVTSTTTTTAATTTTPIMPTTETIPGGTKVCATECFQFLSTPMVELIKGDFSLTLYTDACSNFTLYEQCVETHKDCDTSDIPQHFTLRDPFAYSCGPGNADILSQKSCWDKPAVKEAWTSCLIGPRAPMNLSNVCNIFGTQMSCLSSSIAQHCDTTASGIVLDFFSATIQRVMLVGNCTLSVTTPTPQSETTTQSVTPEPEPEGEPSTPEPEAEVTAEPNMTSPEPEVTAEPVATSPEPEVTTGPSCDIIAYSQCLVDLNQKIQSWISTVTSAVASTNTFNISHIDSLCSTFFNEYKPCTSSVIRGCQRDVTLIHDTLTSALDYICTVDRDALLNTLSCLGQPTVIPRVQTCRNNIPLRSTDICQVSQDFATCLSDVTSGVCNEAARSTLAELVSLALQPLNNFYPCEATTTTTTTTTTLPSTSTTESTTTAAENVTDTVVSGPIECYECHSGYGSHQNPFCSREGDVADWYATAVLCDDRCFARTNKWNEGVVVRGCAGQHLPQEHPRPLRRSGCETINGETWCFCDTNKCNTMSMLEYLP